MMSDPHGAPHTAPLNPLPPVVWVLALPMIVLEVIFSLADAHLIGGAQAIGWRTAAIEMYGLWPEYWRQKTEIGAYDYELLRRFVTYPFVSMSATQTLFAVAMLAALGKFVGDVFRWWAVLAVFFAAAIVGGLVYVTVAERQPLYGAFASIYGLIGAFSFLLWVRLAGTGIKQFRAFVLIGGLMLFQLIFGLVFSVGAMWFDSLKGYGIGWTWVALLPGFVVGFLLSFVVCPGGFGRVLARIRQR
jgi:membrane associated rhomboid family serine protease